MVSLISDDLQYLHEMEIQGQEVTLLEMKMLSNGLKRNKNIKSLRLVGCGLGNSGRIVNEFLDGF